MFKSLEEFVRSYSELNSKISNEYLISVSHPDSKARENASNAKIAHEKDMLNMFNKANYDNIKWQYEIMGKIINKFKDNGCGNSEVAIINNELAELETQFNKNIADEQYKLELSTSEMNELSTNDSLYILTPAVYENITTMCSNEILRRRAVLEKDRIIVANLSIMKKFYELRQRKANLLGFSCVSKMIHSNASISNAEGFLNEVITKLRPKVQQDLIDKSNLLKVSIDELTKHHNRRYYNNKYMAAVHKADLGADVFKTSKVIEVIKEIYSEILGVSVTEGHNNKDMWLDLPSLKVTGGTGGFIYLDLSAREGKYPHPSEWPYFSGENHETENAYLICDAQEYISHIRLESIFHELGHCFNVILNEVGIAGVGGINTHKDIVEVPSMYFEKYVWRADNLVKFGISRELAENIAQAETTLVAEQMLLNACMALVDIKLNDGEITVEGAPEYMEKISGFEYTHGNNITRWVHQTGYECNYYAYVYAACWAANITEDKIGEYIRYSSAENLNNLFGLLDVDKFIKKL